MTASSSHKWYGMDLKYPATFSIGTVEFTLLYNPGMHILDNNSKELKGSYSGVTNHIDISESDIPNHMRLRFIEIIKDTGDHIDEYKVNCIGNIDHRDLLEFQKLLSKYISTHSNL